MSAGYIRNLSGLVFAHALLNNEAFKPLMLNYENIVERIARSEVKKLNDKVLAFLLKDNTSYEKAISYGKSHIAKFVFGFNNIEFLIEYVSLILIDELINPLNNPKASKDLIELYLKLKKQISYCKNLINDTHSKYDDNYLEISKTIAKRIANELKG